MTRDDIIRMAREAGWKDLPTVRLAFAGFNLERFAVSVAAAEREACAKVCIEIEQSEPLSDRIGWEHGTVDCAEAIRARGNK